MFTPNNSGRLSVKQGKDLYAQRSYAAPITVRCSVVNLSTKIKTTPVRDAESASRTNAEEEVSSSKILFPPSVNISDEDKFEIAGVTLRVNGVRSRFDAMGRFDHKEVDFDLWQR